MQLRFLALFISLAFPAMAGDVSLAWDPSSSPDVAGYRVYYGEASRVYGTPIQIGKQTIYTVTGLPDGVWFFSVTAFDASGNESDFSNEVSTAISAVISCDVNGDASINMLDLQTMANAIVKQQSIPLIHDLNQDGRIDVLDLQILANVVLGKRTCP